MKHFFKIFLSMILLLSSSFVYAQQKEKYISPNSDGVQDELIIPIKIIVHLFNYSPTIVKFIVL